MTALARGRRPAVWLLVSLFLALSAAPGGEASSCQTITDWLLVPTGSSPPPVVDESMQIAKIVHYVKPIVGSTYELEAVAETVASPQIPDFNIAWYKAGGGLDIDHDAPGDQTGNIPVTAAFGVIYMAFGPDVGTSDGAVGARFVYQEC